MSSGGETPKLKSQGSRHDTTNSSLANIGGAQQNLQVLNDRKVLMIYASGATAAEGEVSESHMTVLKGRLEQRLKNISFLCDLEYKYMS